MGGGKIRSQALMSVATYERICLAEVVQTWKPGKHSVLPQPEYLDLFSMLSRYACQVWGPRHAVSGSWQSVTLRSETLTRILRSGQPPEHLLT
eukprot:1146999-Pelagomonas_calceolata.AAC.9